MDSSAAVDVSWLVSLLLHQAFFLAHCSEFDGFSVSYHSQCCCVALQYALTRSASFLPRSADKWKFCPYCGLGPVKASEGIIEQPIWLTQILILPLNRPLAACFMGLFSTRHFECCSIHGPSFPRTAFSLSPWSFLSPFRLRGLVSQASGNGAPLCEDETSKSASMTRRSWAL